MIIAQGILLLLAGYILINGNIFVTKNMSIPRPNSVYLGILILLYFALSFLLTKDILLNAMFYVSLLLGISFFVLSATLSNQTSSFADITTHKRKKKHLSLLLILFSISIGVVMLVTGFGNPQDSGLVFLIFWMWPLSVPIILGAVFLLKNFIEK